MISCGDRSEREPENERVYDLINANIGIVLKAIDPIKTVRDYVALIQNLSQVATPQYQTQYASYCVMQYPDQKTASSTMGLLQPGWQATQKGAKPPITKTTFNDLDRLLLNVLRTCIPAKLNQRLILRTPS